VADIVVSSPTDMSAAPAIWVNGISATSVLTGSGTGAPTTNTNGLILGRRPDGATRVASDVATRRAAAPRARRRQGRHRAAAARRMRPRVGDPALPPGAGRCRPAC
jgi:hypothetical protein